MIQRFGSKRRALLACVVLASAVVLGSGYAYGALTTVNNQYTGCLLSGTISYVQIGSTPLKPCQKPAMQISWSQTGPPGTNGTNGTDGTNGTNGTNGTDGVSVTSASEPAGANCADGGSKFTAANGVTYACNGAPGAKGDTGATGPSSLNALDGSPCTFNNLQSKTRVNVNSTTGAVSLTCQPLATVSVTATGGSLFVRFKDFTVGPPPVTCTGASCSATLPIGDAVQVEFQGSAAYNYTCPGESARAATLQSGVYVGSCQPPGQILTGDYAITATFTG